MVPILVIGPDPWGGWFQLRATIRDEMKARAVTGAQILSILLGVIVFIMVPTAVKRTTAQMVYLEM